ncbi:MAG: recombination protein RecR [Candidatus Hydrogenedentes bacterium]|nr:recombination protein RecR [Candidatus Hydrogenedentota bacterium]
MATIQSESIRKLIGELKRLPGIGAKSAERITFHILDMPRDQASELAGAITDVKERIKLCSVCCNVTETEPCPICSSEKRDRSVICVVEKPSNVAVIDKGGAYNGLYHVLHGLVSPLSGVRPEDVTIGRLLDRLREGNVKEMVVATNPTVDGESTALYLAKVAKPFGVTVTRIARGVPVGGDIELADEATLVRAIEGRTKL